MENEILKEVLSSVKSMQSQITGLVSDVAGLKTDVAGLKEDVATLKTDVADLKEGQARLESSLEDVAIQTANLLQFRQEVMTDIKNIKQNQEFLIHKYAEHDREIFKINKYLLYQPDVPQPSSNNK